MRAVAPRIEGLAEVTLAEDQHEYKSVTVAPVEYADGSRSWITRWRLSPEELEAVGRGSDVYVEILGDRMAPVSVSIGAPAHLWNP